MSEHQRAQHIFLAHFLGTGLDHVDGLLRTGDRQRDIAFLCLLAAWVDDIFSIHAADLYTGDRSVEGNIRYAQCQGCAQHRRHLRRAVLIDGKHRVDDLHFIAETIRKQRTDRTVDHTRRQGRMLAGTSFPTQEAARDLTDRVQLFFKADGQREKVNSFLWLIAGGSCRQDDRIIVTHEDRTTRLLGNLAGFHCDHPTTEI